MTSFIKADEAKSSVGSGECEAVTPPVVEGVTDFVMAGEVFEHGDGEMGAVAL